MRVLLTVDEVADRLGFHPRSVRRWIATGRLRAVRVAEGSPWRVHVDALDDFIASLETNEPGYRLPRLRVVGE